MTITPSVDSVSAQIYSQTTQRLASASMSDGATDSAQLPFQALLNQQTTLQASLPSAAPTTMIPSTLLSPATAPVLPPRQGIFVAYEMNSLGGKVTSLNVGGDGEDSLQVGDQWQLSIIGGPPNTELKLLLNNAAYPPPFKPVGKTDAHGTLTLTAPATPAQVRPRPSLPYYMDLPNATEVS